MEEKYKKMIQDRIEYFNNENEKFIQITNVVDGKERIFLMPTKRYNQLTNKQKKFLMEDK